MMAVYKAMVLVVNDGVHLCLIHDLYFIVVLSYFFGSIY